MPLPMERTPAKGGERADTGPRAAWRDRLFTIIFGVDTPAGKQFDVALLIAILLSIAAVMLESVDGIRTQYGGLLRAAEWGFTILFTVEYALRIIAVPRPLHYVTSFFGVIDLLAVLPTYLSLLISGTHSLIVIRAFRLLRIFRVFKLARFLGEASVLAGALRASLPKITVFLGAVISTVVVTGTLMYLVEGPERGFDSIPRGTYWAIVTLTTVGYGDLAPATFWGQFIAACVMIMGYGIIAVPTGIVTVELVQAARREAAAATCPSCRRSDHDADARFCKVCGGLLRLMNGERRPEA
jgi:voltage-gated potassium channel